MSKVETTGKYKVGVRYIRTPSKGNKLMVMYPADYKKELADDNDANATWIEKESLENELQGLANLYKVRQKFPFVPYGLLQHAGVIKMGALIDGDLSTSFSHGRKKIRPLIFSHGLSASNWFYT